MIEKTVDFHWYYPVYCAGYSSSWYVCTVLHISEENYKTAVFARDGSECIGGLIEQITYGILQYLQTILVVSM
jgi:hypothetical protein